MGRRAARGTRDGVGGGGGGWLVVVVVVMTVLFLVL